MGRVSKAAVEVVVIIALNILFWFILIYLLVKDL